MLDRTLTARQRQVLDFIVAGQAKGRSPTLKEIANALGLARGTGAVAHLQALKKKGYVTWKKRFARSITVLDTGRAETVWGSFPIGV